MHLLKFILLLVSFMVGTQSAQETRRSVISKSGKFDKKFFDSLFYNDQNDGVDHVQSNGTTTIANERNDGFGISAFENWSKGSMTVINPSLTIHPQSSPFGSLYNFQMLSAQQASFGIRYQNNVALGLQLNDNSFGTMCDVFNELFNVDDFITSIQTLPDIESEEVSIIFLGDTNCNRDNFNGEFPWYTKITQNKKFRAIFNPTDRMSTPMWIKNQKSPSENFPTKKETFGKSFISRSGYYDRAFFDDILNVTIVEDYRTSFKAINFTESASDNPHVPGLHELKNVNPQDVVERVWSVDSNTVHIDRGFEVHNENLSFRFSFRSFYIFSHGVIMGLAGPHGYLENTTLCSWINGQYFKKDELVDSLIVNLKHLSAVYFFQTTFPGCDNWHQPIVENQRFKKYFKPAEVWKFKSGVPVFSSIDDNLHKELASQVKEEQISSSMPEWTIKVQLGVTDSDEVEAEFIIV